MTAFGRDERGSSMMQRVLVLDHDRNPLMPCHSARARALLRAGKAAIFRRQPFTIILKERVGGDTQPVQIKLDPGSKTTGIALNARFQRGMTTIWGAELTHRGLRIKLLLLARRETVRRGRRNRHTRYRPARFDNRTRPKGWLAPSLQHRVETTLTWVERLIRWTPATAIAQELVRFDLQSMENPEIAGVGYRQGTLAGYEVREYLLEKWGRQCAYCEAQDVPLEIEHIQPKSLGGSDRITNLTLACHACNQKKSNRPVEEFLAKKPDRLKAILAQAKRPLKDAAAVNSTRWALWNRLKATGLTVEVGTGGRTKFNRFQQSMPKAHWIDAACVGASGASIHLDPSMQPLLIKAMGQGTRQMCTTDKYGFPIRHRTHVKRHFGFGTGDLVEAHVPHGKNQGRHIGRVTVRAKGSFDLATSAGAVPGVHHKYCRRLAYADGYRYGA